MTKTGPGPILGFFDQSASDRIAVYVAELFHKFPVREDIEVIITRLPELGSLTFEKFGGLPFQYAKSLMQLFAPGLTQKQMDVFGHENVSEEIELVPLPDVFEDVKEDSARMIGIQIRQAAMTTEGKEVVMAFVLVSLEIVRHARMVARGTR